MAVCLLARVHRSAKHESSDRWTRMQPCAHPHRPCIPNVSCRSDPVGARATCVPPAQAWSTIANGGKRLIQRFDASARYFTWTRRVSGDGTLPGRSSYREHTVSCSSYCCTCIHIHYRDLPGTGTLLRNSCISKQSNRTNCVRFRLTAPPCGPVSQGVNREFSGWLW